ncbi:hypothetical protein NFI96_015523 [Prochilodus magdalenae]|nr:hypothetical protein NFI96_015523 [Prochilodus magdalenae]
MLLSAAICPGESSFSKPGSNTPSLIKELTEPYLKHLVQLGVRLSVFVLSSMDLSREGAYATVIIVLPAYIFTVLCHLLLIGTIVSNRTLHEPMYILLCNLSLNDLIGISALVPRTLFDLMFEYGLITFPACFLQAWCMHTYGSAAYLLLSVMAFDRYAAICHPLRYHSIMSKTTLICLIASSWITVYVLIVVLFTLTLQYPVCRKQVLSYNCSNVTILKLTCATDTTVNNIYGLFITGFLNAVALSSIVFTYTRILITCCKTSDSDSRSKAWHTCGTHLTVFVIYEISTNAIVLAHRFPDTHPVFRKIMGLAYVIVPSCLNPVIYGLNTKNIKAKALNGAVAEVQQYPGTPSPVPNYRVEVRTLCRPVQFLHTRLAHPCLYGVCSVHWCAVMLEQEGAVPKLSPQSWEDGMVQSLLVC